MNHNLPCIHGIKKDDFHICGECVNIRLKITGNAFRKVGIKASEAGQALAKAFKSMPEELHQVMDEEVERRRRKKNKKVIINLSLLVITAILIWQVTRRI